MCSSDLAQAPLVVIPTAAGAESYPDDWSGLKLFKDFGVTNITVLHTSDRKVADSEAFVRPLTTAKAVWFVGGRQWRLVDSYLHTRTQLEVERVLERGAGAACWFARRALEQVVEAIEVEGDEVGGEAVRLGFRHD